MYALMTANFPFFLLCFLLIAACIAFGYLLYIWIHDEICADKHPALEWPKLDNIGDE